MWDEHIPPEFRDAIVIGDARELAEQIPDESVDLIFTDPVYQNMDDYHWLAETAARILKPNRAALIWGGIGYLPETLSALVTGGLTYKWTLVSALPMGFASRFCMNKVFSNWQILLWFQKGKSQPLETISDLVYQHNSGRHTHKWNKNLNPLLHYLGRFTAANNIVFDPFTGSGAIPAVCKMLGRRYIAFEIDSGVAEQARLRVCSTQPPLFVLSAEQLPLLGPNWNESQRIS